MSLIRLHANRLNSTHAKIRGLIGADPVYPVWFTTRWGIHTFGMLHPLDILILDRSFRIAAMKERLLPNRIFFWNPVHSIVVELPHGVITQNSMTVGMPVLLQDHDAEQS